MHEEAIESVAMEKTAAQNGASEVVEGTAPSEPPSSVFDEKIATIAQLREKFPEFFNKLLENMMSNIVIEMRRYNEHIKAAYKRLRH